MYRGFLIAFAAALAIASGQVIVRSIVSKSQIDLGLLFNPKIVGALLLCGFGSLAYLYSLSLVEVSRAIPVTAGLIISFTCFLAWCWLGEVMSIQKMVGVATIVAGIVVTLRA